MAELLGDGMPGREHYHIGEEVGHGRFSEVYKAREKATGRTVALKHMGLSEPGKLPKHVERERAALGAVCHPNVVSLLGWHQQGFSVALALEFCVTDLRRVLQPLKGAPLDPALAKSIMRQLLQAIHACHQAGFMHRDVSPSNVLVAQGTGLVKLGDFGQARSFQAPQGLPAPGPGAAPALNQGGLTPTVGTRWYKAPELMYGAHAYSPAVDLWSAGCVFAELLSGRPLFPGTSDIDQICRMHEVLGTIREADWPGVCDLPDWGKLVFPEKGGKGLAAVLPGAPPAALDLLQGLLQYNPEHRLSAEAALAMPYFIEHPEPAPPQVLAALVEQHEEEERSRQQRFLQGEEDEEDLFQLPFGNGAAHIPQIPGLNGRPL